MGMQGVHCDYGKTAPFFSSHNIPFVSYDFREADYPQLLAFPIIRFGIGQSDAVEPGVETQPASQPSGSFSEVKLL